MNPNKDFRDMVMTLANPGQALKDSWTAKECHVMHMLIGLVGEVTELEQAWVAGDILNIKEELGDADFYLEGIKDAFDLPLEPNVHSEDSLSMLIMFEELRHVLSGDSSLLDGIKRVVIYRKPGFGIDDFVAKIERIDVLFNTIAEHHGWTRQDVRDYNQAKLAVRYKDGYSNEAAVNRADKS